MIFLKIKQIFVIFEGQLFCDFVVETNMLLVWNKVYAGSVGRECFVEANTDN